MSCAVTDYNCIVDMCSGTAGTGTALFDYWDNNNCPAAYAQLINTSPSGELQYNPANQAVAQTSVVNLFNTYFETNELTDDVTSPSFNSFQNTLLNLCIDSTLPGICTEFLTGYCANYTRTDAINSATLTNFCGCYVPPDATYLSYTLGTTGCLIGDPSCASCAPGTTGCAGQPACDPLCHRALTSQQAYAPTGNFITCPQTICVIDNVTIDINSSTVPGGINFNNVCAGCGGASGGEGCLCIVSGTNVSETMSSIGVGVNFNQFCGADSVCIVEDSNGNIISESGCTGINPANAAVPEQNALPNLGFLGIIIFLVFLVLLLCIFARIDATPPKPAAPSSPELITQRKLK